MQSFLHLPMMNVLVTKVIPQRGIDVLEAAGHSVTTYAKKQTLAQKELIQMCQSQDALLSVGPNRLDAHFFKTCRNLKAVALMSAGYDNVDVEAASSNGIPVSNVRDVLSNATSDIAFLLMLSVLRNAFNMHKSIEKGEWKSFEPTANLGMELYGKTLGIFGLGSIGIELAKKAKAAYQMKIIYHNRNRNSAAEDLLMAEYVSFDQLLTQSDVLSVHANLSGQTRALFNRSTFEKMKPSSIFINTARGGMHDEQDLIEALKNKTIWGAGLDVTNPEPMDRGNALLNMPNVCILPHIGSATVEARSKMAEMAAENIVAALNGNVMPQVISGL